MTNTTTSALGYSSYHDYLNSSLWKRIRERVFKAKGKKCYCCRNEAEAVHHKYYSNENMSGQSLKGLYPICHLCHTIIHYDGQRKRSDSEHKQKFRELRALKLHPLTDLKACAVCSKDKPRSEFLTKRKKEKRVCITCRRVRPVRRQERKHKPVPQEEIANRQRRHKQHREHIRNQWEGLFQ